MRKYRDLAGYPPQRGTRPIRITCNVPQNLMREIDGLSDVERELERRVSSLKQFRDPSNIAQCALFAKNHEDQHTVLALAHGLGKSAAEQAQKNNVRQNQGAV
jgi:hypothetical protein